MHDEFQELPEDRFNALELETSELDSRISGLESKTSELESETSGFDFKISQMESEISELKSEISQLESKTSRMEENMLTWWRIVWQGSCFLLGALLVTKIFKWLGW